LGRVLAEDVAAPLDLPPFDRAAMDGYAVRAEDVEGASFSSPRVLKLVGSSEVGRSPGTTVSKGEAVRIDNGAPLPKGADAVVPLEYAREIGERLEVYRSVVRWENVSRKGEDVSEGELVLRRGKVLRPWDVALLQALGLEEVEVRAPRVAVLSTGTELQETLEDALARPGSIVDTNRPMLARLLEACGCDVVKTEIVRDTGTTTVLRKLEETLELADLVVVTGGCSVGRKDYVAKALSKLGDMVFHGVAIRPGMPTAAAFVGKSLVVGLPGSPVAAFVSYKLFVETSLSVLTSACDPRPKPLEANLAEKVDSTPGFMDLVRAVYSEGVVRPVRRRGATLLSSLSKSHGVIAVPEDYEGLREGARVRLYLHWQSWLGILEGEVP